MKLPIVQIGTLTFAATAGALIPLANSPEMARAWLKASFRSK